MSKGPPIPTRFEEAEAEAIRRLQEMTGLNAADVIRRSVRLMWRHVQEEGIGVVLSQTARPVELEIVHEEEDLPIAAEAPPFAARAQNNSSLTTIQAQPQEARAEAGEGMKLIPFPSGDTGE